MSTTKATVADACRIVADRTGDQQAAHILHQAGGELDRLTAELAKHQPEERVGECWCEHYLDAYAWGVPAGDVICTDWDGCAKSGCPLDNDGDGPACCEDAPKPRWLEVADPDSCIVDSEFQYCPGCGAHLCADGIARRNADAARVARVREALDKLEGGCPAYPENVKRNRNRVTRAIRAALDQEVGDGG